MMVRPFNSLITDVASLVLLVKTFVKIKHVLTFIFVGTLFSQKKTKFQSFEVVDRGSETPLQVKFEFQSFKD